MGLENANPPTRKLFSTSIDSSMDFEFIFYKAVSFVDKCNLIIIWSVVIIIWLRHWKIRILQWFVLYIGIVVMIIIGQMNISLLPTSLSLLYSWPYIRRERTWPQKIRPQKEASRHRKKCYMVESLLKGKDQLYSYNCCRSVMNITIHTSIR